MCSKDPLVKKTTTENDFCLRFQDIASILLLVHSGTSRCILSVSLARKAPMEHGLLGQYYKQKTRYDKQPLLLRLLCVYMNKHVQKMP